MKYVSIKHICILVAIVAVILLILTGIKKIYDSGYHAGYDAGYTTCAESMSIPVEEKKDAVQVGTTVATITESVVRPKKKVDEPSIVVKTEEPKILASVNGKKYEFEPKSEYLGTTVKTTGVINIKVPERKWAVGIGYSKDKSVGYLLKGPVSGPVGFWVAGSGKKSVMAGISISF